MQTITRKHRKIDTPLIDPLIEAEIVAMETGAREGETEPTATDTEVADTVREDIWNALQQQKI